MKTVLAIVMTFALTTVAGAADADRFQMEKTADGYVRLDRQTGAMSLCAEQGGQLVCRAAVDEHQAENATIGELAARVEALEKKVAALQQGAAPAAGGLPSDEEFEKAMGFMERFFKRFMDIVRGFEKETEHAPQKT